MFDLWWQGLLFNMEYCYWLENVLLVFFCCCFLLLFFSYCDLIFKLNHPYLNRLIPIAFLFSYVQLRCNLISTSCHRATISAATCWQYMAYDTLYWYVITSPYHSNITILICHLNSRFYHSVYHVRSNCEYETIIS